MKSARKNIRLKRQRDGRLRAHWYGQYQLDGRNREVNLNVKWEGVPPASGKWRESGDGDFEISRKEAEIALDAHVEEARHKGRAEHLTERVIEMKTGRKFSNARIEELPALYRKRGKMNGASEAHLSRNCDPTFKRFILMMKERNAKAEYLYQVTEDDAAAFVQSERAKYSKSTAQRSISRVLNTLGAFLPVGAANPFAQFKGSYTEGEVIHREPFTPDELSDLLDVAQSDPFMYPLIVTAACTGARQADVCHLRWKDCDLEGGMIAVKTRKTGKPVEIPIFAPLRKVLEGRTRNGSEYVFPDAVKMYATRRHKLGRDFKALVVRSIEGDTPNTSPPRVPASDVLDEGVTAIVKEYQQGARRDRIEKHFRMYCEVNSVRKIEAATGCPRSTVSADLHVVQELIGKQFLPPKPDPSIKTAVAHLTRVKRGNGQKSASIKDWHTLRTTFITLALSAGVPIELVKRVTGHATVEVVLAHYFRPDREQFRAALTSAMPDVLTGSKAKRLKPADELAALAGKIAAGTATEKDKKRLRMLAAKV